MVVTMRLPRRSFEASGTDMNALGLLIFINASFSRISVII